MRRRARAWVGAALVCGLARVSAGAPEANGPDADAEHVVTVVAAGRSVRAVLDEVESDPWLVAEALVARRATPVAKAWAAAWAERAPHHEAIRAYVAAASDAPPTPAPLRAAIVRARDLLSQGNAEAASLALESFGAPTDGVMAAERASLLAGAYRSLGRPNEAAAASLAAADGAHSVGWVVREAAALRDAGVVFTEAFNPSAARAAFERRVAVLRGFGSDDGVARALNDAAVATYDGADFAGALEHLEAALAIRERIGTPVDTAELLAHAATAECGRGQFGRALSRIDRAASLAASSRPSEPSEPRALARQSSVAAWIEHGRGVVCLQCGRLREARTAFEHALAAARHDGDDTLSAFALGNLAIVHAKDGDAAAAERVHLEALTLFERLHDSPRIAQVFANLADLLSEAGRHEEAIAYQERALARMQELGDPLAAARTRGSIGTLRRRAGQPKRAIEDHEAARLQAESIGATFVEAEQWVGIAAARLDLGDAAAAVDAARRAFEVFRTFAFGVGDAVGISLEEAYEEMFEVGALAAARLGDAPLTATMLETGRSAQLISGLGGRDALAAISVPAALLAEERAARSAETVALAAWLTEARKERPDRELHRRWTEARDRAAAVVDRIQREQATAAAITYPAPVALDEVRRALAPADAFVWYGVFPRGVVALVATKGAARVVRLEVTEAALTRAVEVLVDGDGTDATPEALAALGRLAVAPLGLGPEVRRVVVCPAGALAYAPLGALFEGRTVALAPSATALALLARDATRHGQGILAVGDPAYGPMANGSAVQLMRGELRLTALPATRDEALAIAEGLPPLIGGEATEAGLRRALASAKGRLRAVHLACHGLVDREQPLHSSLALTAAGDDDGYLTGAELLRMRVEADLVVLSACSSGLGRVARGEGMLGLTRAFMFSGVPRIVASLWKVDDAATKALMLRFYAKWQPKDASPAMTAAEALRDAQAFVRAQPRWAHPRYWAGWVLWGVLD
ncbi:MAG: CHAT domain-containing tetratricopeptide repeat protein [Planctomycetota bacterium]